MNLFDYIKYKTTDISNYDELFALPDEILNKYWVECLDGDCLIPPDRERMCRIFADWARGFDASPLPQVTFDKVMDELKNEPT